MIVQSNILVLTPQAYPLFSRLTKPFSRYEYALAMTSDGEAVLPVTGLRFQIPFKATNISFRDAIGNISTSHYAIRETKKSPPHVGILDVSPRYPLYGGFSTSFEISYNIPLETYHSQTDSKHHLRLPIFQLFSDISLQNFEFYISFPEGSHSIDPLFPFSGKSLDVSFEKSYLDLVGRLTLHFSATSLVKEHSHDFVVSYDYPAWKIFWHPLLFIIICIMPFFLYYCFKKVAVTPFVSKIEDLTIVKTKAE
jgi:oligosaccharyltransferase complex subunit alpha (ribophorin I)